MIEVMEREKNYSFSSVVSQATQLAYRIARGQGGREEGRNPFIEGEGELGSDVIPIPEEIWNRLRSGESPGDIPEEIWEEFITEYDLDIEKYHDKGRVERLSGLGLDYLKCVDKGVESLWEEEDPEFFWTAAFYRPDGTPLNAVYAVRADPRFTWNWLTGDYFLLSRFASMSLKLHENRVPSGIALKWSCEGEFSSKTCGSNFEHYLPSIETRTAEPFFEHNIGPNEYNTNHDTTFGSELRYNEEEAKEWWRRFFGDKHSNLIGSQEECEGGGIALNKEGEKHLSDYFATVGAGLGISEPSVEEVNDSSNYRIKIDASQICAYAFPLLVSPPTDDIDQYLETSSLAVLFVVSTSPIPPDYVSRAHLLSQTLAPIASTRMQRVVSIHVDELRRFNYAHLNLGTIKSICKDLEEQGIFDDLQRPTYAALMGLKASTAMYRPGSYDYERQFPGIHDNHLKNYTLVAAGDALSRATEPDSPDECFFLAKDIRSKSNDAGAAERLIKFLGDEKLQYSVPTIAQDIVEREGFGVIYYHILSQALYHSLKTYSKNESMYFPPKSHIHTQDDNIIKVEVLNCGLNKEGESKEKSQLREMAKYYKAERVHGPGYKKTDDEGNIHWSTGFEISFKKWCK